MITGTITYKNIDFTFVFDHNELRLIPPTEKRDFIHFNWLMKEIKPGMYANGDPLEMEERYLIGRCNEDGRKVIFFTNYGAGIDSFNTVLIVDITAYILCRFDRDVIDRISFESPELNYIFPANMALEYSIGGLENDGAVGVTASNGTLRTIDKERFIVAGKSVEVSFNITHTLSAAMERAPITVSTSMDFDFEPTDDYDFIFQLWIIARRFVQYLCFRQNIGFTKTRLSTPYKGNKHETFAEMVAVPEHITQDQKSLKRGRYIKHGYLEGTIGKLLQSIADNNLYLRHIPKTFESSHTIDESSFVLITAAFEWEFRRLFPEGVKKKTARTNAERTATQKLGDLIKESRGELKNIYKFLSKLIESDSLAKKILYTGKELDSVITIFGERLYQMNGEKLKYAEMGERIAAQRNDFAHGNLDKDFNGLAFLDLVYLKWIIYAMQLKCHGVSDINIQSAINDLFGQGINLPYQQNTE